MSYFELPLCSYVVESDESNPACHVVRWDLDPDTGLPVTPRIQVGERWIEIDPDVADALTNFDDCEQRGLVAAAIADSAHDVGIPARVSQ